MKTVAGSSVKQTNKYRHIKLNRKYQILKIKFLLNLVRGPWLLADGPFTTRWV